MSDLEPVIKDFVSEMIIEGLLQENRELREQLNKLLAYLLILESLTDAPQIN